nr:ABC transporter permease [Mycoplasmatales bacterium]
VFSIMYLSPSDPARIILGEVATDESLHSLREELGLNDPFIVQYSRFLFDFIRLDFGESYFTGKSVSSEILERFPNTVVLTVASMIIAIAVAIPVGIISCVKRYTFIDNASMFLALLGVSIPNFWLGLMLINYFAVTLNVLPSSGFNDGFSSLVLPAITLGTSAMAVITRMTRSTMLDEVNKDYIRTAKSKGVSDKVIILKHAFRNSLLPIVTVVGLQFGYLLGGAVLTERVFAWPGVGNLLIDAILKQDVPMVLGVVMFITIIFSIVNLMVDISYVFIDPKLRTEITSKKKKKKKVVGGFNAQKTTS